MTMTVEGFYIDGTRAGTIVRHLADGRLRTVTSFEEPDGVRVHVEHCVLPVHDPFAWTEYFYVDHMEETRLSVRRVGTAIVEELGERSVAVSARAIPSYAERLLLERLIRDGLDRVEYSRLDDAEPWGHAGDAVLELGEAETIQLPDGTARTCSSVERRVDGEVTARYWFDGSGVVKSDWMGAESYVEQA